MVEKTKKIIRTFLCFLVAVILPFSFVGCKNSKSGGDVAGVPELTNPSDNGSGESDDSSQNDTSNPSQDENSGDDQKEPVSQEVIYTKQEILDLFTSSKELMDDYIVQFNKFGTVLEENNYKNMYGENTMRCLSYAYFPYYIVQGMENTPESKSPINLELNKVYRYSGSGISSVYNYIELVCSEKSSITLNVISFDGSNSVNGDKFKYFKFEFNIANKEIKSLKLSTLFSDGNLEFYDTFFDFENYNFKLNYERIGDVNGDAKAFFNYYFNSENFSSIQQDILTGYYEKFSFADDNMVFEKCLTSSNAALEISSNFDDFGFLDYYDLKDEYDDRFQNGDACDVITWDVFTEVDSAKGSEIIYKNYGFTKSS